MKFDPVDIPMYLNNARLLVAEKYPCASHGDMEALAIIEFEFYLERQLWPVNHSVEIH